MPVQLDLVVPNPAPVRAAYTHIRVYRSPTLAGTYAEITTPSTRPQLGDGTSYPFIDPTGNDSSYYRISYYNERTRAESAQGQPFQGLNDPALDVISVQELRDVYLFGVNLRDPGSGLPFPDRMFLWYIQAAVSWLEMKLEIPLREQTITGEVHDYFREDFSRFQYIQLERKPVIAVDAVRLTFPSQPEFTRTYPAEWIQADLPAGIVRIVPGAGTLALPFFSGGGLLMPTILGGRSRHVPGIHAVDYRAGFARGQVPPAIRHVVGMLAAIGPLNIAGDLIAGAGVANYSISLDGLSQSVGTTSSATNSGYGSRILEYGREIKAQIPIIRDTYRGIPAFSA